MDPNVVWIDAQICSVLGKCAQTCCDTYFEYYLMTSIFYSLPTNTLIVQFYIATEFRSEGF